MLLRIYAMYVKNNLGPASSNGLSADVPCSQSTSVQAQANDFPVKGLTGPCQKDRGKRSPTTCLWETKVTPSLDQGLFSCFNQSPSFLWRICIHLVGMFLAADFLLEIIYKSQIHEGEKSWLVCVIRHSIWLDESEWVLKVDPGQWWLLGGIWQRRYHDLLS